MERDMLKSFLKKLFEKSLQHLKNVKCSLGKGSHQPRVVHRVGLDPKINKTKQTFSYPSCSFIALRGA